MMCGASISLCLYLTARWLLVVVDRDEKYVYESGRDHERRSCVNLGVWNCGCVCVCVKQQQPHKKHNTHDRHGFSAAHHKITEARTSNNDQINTENSHRETWR